MGRAFESEGYCVVRGPDILWGQDVRGWQPARHVFTGIIGGSPCQDFSKARRCAPTGEGVEMLVEFTRIVIEADPAWFLLENVPGVPDLKALWNLRWPAEWKFQRFNLNARECGSAQNRLRCFQFGHKVGQPLVLQRAFPLAGDVAACAMATEGKRPGRRTFADFCELQGLPRDFALPGLTLSARYKAVGNGVPVPMARVVAAAIRSRSVTDYPTSRLCRCHCGRAVPSGKTLATPACRKRVQRQRDASRVTGPGPVTPAASLFG